MISNNNNFELILFPWSEREIWPFLKGSHISETEKVTPIKTGVHARDINPYLHKFFEPIPID